MKTVGFLLESTEDVFGQEMIRGMLKSLAQSECRLVCFSVGIIRTPTQGQQGPFPLFDMVGPTNVDVVLVSGTITHAMSPADLLAFCRRFAPVPVITLSISVPGFAAVVVDDRQGMASVVQHLLNAHGFRKFAFLGGPDQQQEAQARFEVFRDLVQEAGGEHRPEWLLTGDFTRASGIRAAQDFLETWNGFRGQLPFEVLVCANDSMAMGFQDTLADAGWDFPSDLAVTGYDDLPASRIHAPPLTTVLQSLAELAEIGGRLALKVLEGAEISELTLLAPELRVRASCGCSAPGTASSNASLQGTWDELIQDSRENVAAWDHLERVRGLSEALLTAATVPELMETLGQNLVRAGFRGFWLSLYEPLGTSLHSSQLMLSRQPGDAFHTWVPGLPFDNHHFVPQGWPEIDRAERLFVVESLRSHALDLGFLVLNADERDTRVSGNLRSQISGALQAVLLREERAASQKQLLQSEKMAALGSLVAGVAHEINTPLGVAITATSFLVERAQLFDAAVSRGELNLPAASTLLGEILRAGDAIQKTLSRAATLISSFKNVAADQKSERRELFDLKAYLEMALVSLEFQWKHRPIALTLEGPTSLVLDSYPGAIAQLVSNLVQNSLLHAFAPEQTGTIRSKLVDRGNMVLWTYDDDGAGILAENLPRIFEPFFTTKRAQGGTGLGLHIVYNVVTNILGGTVKVSSQIGHGTHFEFILPKKAPDETT